MNEIKFYNGDELAETLKACGMPCAFIQRKATPATVVYKFKPTAPQYYEERNAKKAAARLSLILGDAITFSPAAGGFALFIDRPQTFPPFADFAPLLKDYNGAAAFPLGVDDNNNPRAVRLDDCPHVLIAGASGSGKTIFLHSFIAALAIFSRSVQFLLIDAKKTEFNSWAGLKTLNRLAAPIVYDADDAAAYLNAAVAEMEARFSRLQALGLRDNSRGTFPPLVIVVDELADIMLSSKKAVEMPLVRIAQKGRAAGVHLVLATQRPTINVVTGLIKANIPMRVCFSVASVRDSVVLLDRKGGERLRGRGDALVQLPSGERLHVQAPFFNPAQIAQICPPPLPAQPAPPLPQSKPNYHAPKNPAKTLFLRRLVNLVKSTLKRV